jgi:hypothetical protein
MSWTHYRSQKKIGRILQICYKGNLVTLLLLYYILRYWSLIPNFPPATVLFPPGANIYY